MTGDDLYWPGIAGVGQGRPGLLQGHPRRLVGARAVRDYKRKAGKRFAIFHIHVVEISVQNSYKKSEFFT